MAHRTIAALLGAAALAASTTFATDARAQQKRELQTIEMGFVAKLAFTWAVFVADNKGWMAENGIKIEPVMVGQSSKVVQQLAAGALPIGHAGAPDIIRGIEAGGAAKIIAAEIAVPPYKMMAKKDITRVEDLKGKKVMLGGTKDITYIYMKDMADKHGLKMSDFEFLYSGSTTNRFAALVSGAIDATLLGQPFDFQAAAQGFSNLGLSKTYSPNSPFTVYAVSSEWAAKNRDTVVGFLKAYLRGIDFLYDPKNEAEVTAVLIKETSAKPDDAAKTYDFYVKELQPFRRDGAVTPAAMADILKSLVALEDLKEPTPPASKYYDDSFIKAAQAAK